MTPYTVESRRFRDQMRFLKVQRTPVIPLASLVNHLRSGIPVPDHAVVITIDDGYKTARTKAWPILKQQGFPFTLFIYPQFLGKPGALSWEDVKAMSDAGVDIQSHSLTHPLLTHPDRPMSHAEYVAWLDQELGESKRLIEEHLGKPVRYLAYPFGGYDETVVERTRRAGYEGALTCDDGNVTRFNDALHINRRLVYHGVKLKEYTRYFPDRTLQMVELSPRDGERVRRPITEIQARVLNVSQILPDSAWILVDKVSKTEYPVRIDSATGLLRFPLPRPPKKGYYFVSLFARDKALSPHNREASWVFIISKNTSKN